MAIIVKEEKSRLDIVAIAVIGAIVAIVAALVYYVFFSPTPLAENIPPPQGYEDVSKISKLRIDAEGIVNSPVWRSLQMKEDIPVLDIIITGRRTNPFELTNGSTKVSR